MQAILTALEIVGVIVLIGGALTLILTLRRASLNRSAWTFDQTIQLSGYPEADLRECLRQGWLSSRREYILFGQRFFDPHTVARTHAYYLELQRIRAENKATIQRITDDTAAQNSIYQEEIAAQQAELERMTRIYDAILKSMRKTVLPAEIVDALHVLGLSQDVSFDHIRRQWRILVKRTHPDTGGDPDQFRRINEAYLTVKEWIESEG